jgi:putative nucleotidyltransferase with HDIG domain
MPSAQYFISKFKDIKTLPHVVTRLSQLLNDDDCTMKDFEEVIKMDPTLVARLLRLVNSPYYGLIQRVDSIGRAITFIGMKNIHNTALTEALKNIFNEKDSSTTFSRNKLWLHCASVSICNKMLAERIFGVNGDDAYLCGILHDFGLIIEEQVAPEKFISLCDSLDPEVELPQQERAVLGTDHCEIGYLLTKEWNMTESIQNAIRDHHNIDDTLEPGSLTGMIKLSEYITGQLNYTALPELSPSLPPSLAAHVQDNIDEYKVLIDDLPEEMSKAKDIYEAKEA